MLFLCACSGIYLVLAIWYFCGMRSYQDSAIPIQKFILGSIVLGFLMHVLKSVDFVLWNQTGLRSEVLMYVGKFTSLRTANVIEYMLCLLRCGVVSYVILTPYFLNVSHWLWNSFPRFLALFGSHGRHGLGSRARLTRHGILQDCFYGSFVFWRCSSSRVL